MPGSSDFIPWMAVGNHLVCLSMRLTRPEDRYISGSLMCMILRKEEFWPLSFILLPAESQGLERQVMPPTPCSSARQPWDSMDSHFITEGLWHQMSHPLLMGLAASGVNPSSKWMSSLPLTFGQKTCSNGSQRPSRPEWRCRWQEKKRPRGRYPAQ